MTKAQLRALRDRLYLTDDIPDEALEGDPPYVRPAEGSDAMEYLRARGRVLDGPLPVRVVRKTPALAPDDKVFEEFAAGSGTQSVSTTMVFARLLRNLVRDPNVGSLVAPDRLGRGPHLRPRGHHRRGQDLRPRGPALHPGRRRPAPALRREHLGPDAPGGHHRGRRPGLVHRAGHRLRHLGPAHGAGVPLLFDVRLPASGRPGLVARRHPGSRHPGRLHGRAHHPDG